MALEPSIALGVKPVEIANPLNQFAQVAQLQHYQQQNALAQRAMEQEDGLNRAYASSIGATGEIDPNMLRRNLIAANLGSKLPAVEKTLMEGRKLKAEVGQKELELGIAQQNRAIRELAQYNTLADVNAHIDKNLADGKITPQQAAQTRAGLPVSDADFPKWQLGMLRKTLDTKDLLEQHFVSQNTGGATRVLAMPKHGGGPAQVVQGSQAAMTATPGELLTDARARENIEIARARENRLAQGPIGTSLTPEQNDALFGENGAVAQGKINPNKINSRNAKMWADAFLKNPNANPVKVAQEVAASDAALKSFLGDGKAAQEIKSTNTAVGHLQSLKDLYAAQQNGDVRAFNAAANAIASQFGGAAPTNLQMAVQIVGPEIAKSVIGTAGSMREREEFVKNLSGKAASPDQFAGAIDTTTGLLTTRLGEVENSYKRQTKRDDFRTVFLNPTSKAILDKATATAAPPSVPATAPSGNGVKFLGFEPSPTK